VKPGARRGGRPRLHPPPILVRLTLTLRRDEDEDLIAFFASVPIGLRPAAVKQALRNGASQVDLQSLPDDDALASALGEFLV
jgi:hypothetical protein